MTLQPPVVVNLRRGYEYDEYIGLGSRWGNLFSQRASRVQAVRLYERRLRILMEDKGWLVDLKGLSGKRLGCHCAPQACHGDSIVKIFLEFYGPNGKMVSGEQCGGNPSPVVGSCGGPSKVLC